MNKYTVTISPTADGQQEYMQIVSEDGFVLNVVLIGEFKIEDSRELAEPDLSEMEPHELRILATERGLTGQHEGMSHADLVYLLESSA